MTSLSKIVMIFLKTFLAVALFGAAAQMLVEAMIPLKSYIFFENKYNL